MEGRPVNGVKPAVPTVRLLQVLRTYCRDLRPAGLQDLRAGLQAGQYPWLRNELAAAISSPDRGLPWWTSAIGEPTQNPPVSHRPVRAEQRRLWKTLFPDESFPA
jgi:hypothetical protein